MSRKLYRIDVNRLRQYRVLWRYWWWPLWSRHVENWGLATVVPLFASYNDAQACIDNLRSDEKRKRESSHWDVVRRNA